MINKTGKKDVPVLVDELGQTSAEELGIRLE